MHPLSPLLAGALMALLAALCLLLLLLLRLLLVLPHGRSRPAAPRKSGDNATLGVFLGSGGHTAEMRQLLSTIDYKKYSPRVYVYGIGDELSLRAVADLEAEHQQQTETDNVNKKAQGSYSLLALPRARKVGEGKVSTLISASKTFVHAFWHTFALPLAQHPATPWVDVLVLNGPGTGVVLVMVAYIRRILGLSYTRIIYVESFARVKSLSLSAKILRPLVDKFVVQWPQAAGPFPVSATTKAAAPETDKPASAESLREKITESTVTYRGWLV